MTLILPLDESLHQTRRGTNSQAQLLAAIERAVARLDELCASDLVPAVRPQADEAAGLARSAQATARTVARAVDQLDGAVAQLTAVGRDGDGEGSAVGRLRRRREALLERLRSTADQLLDVYGSLVETDATFATSTFGSGDLAAGDAQALAAVSASLDDLRAIASELEATGRQELPPGATG
jgi:ketosteroid isomerase-like protein